MIPGPDSNLRLELIVFWHRLSRRIALLPYLRLAAIPLWIAGAVALLVSGLVSVEKPAGAIPGFLAGVLFLTLGTMLWELE